MILMVVIMECEYITVSRLEDIKLSLGFVIVKNDLLLS